MTAKAPLARAALITLVVLVLVGLALTGCRSQRRGSWQPGQRPMSVPGTREWYASNEPIVKEYLTTLPESAVGSALSGIMLSDGKRWFEGYVYLGTPRLPLPPQLRVRLLRKDDRVLAYMWLEEGGESVNLEACEEQEAGIRARRLTGEVHAWRSLRPEHGVVFTACPPEAWYEPSTDGG